MTARIAAILMATLMFGGPAVEAQLRPDTASRMFAEHRQAHAMASENDVYWIGDTAPVFISIAREIQDPGAVDEGYDWIYFSCSADGPKNIRTGDWFLSLDIILLDKSGRIIYLSETDEDLDYPGGLCYFEDIDTWLEDNLISHSFIEFPEELEPASVLVYVPSSEEDDVEIVSDTYTSLHRPVVTTSP